MKRSYLFSGVSIALLLQTAVYAQPFQKVSDLPLAKVREIHHYFSDPKNRVVPKKIEMPTRYSWQHTSEFYPTAQIVREGRVHPLEKDLDAKIGSVTFYRGDHKESVQYHLSNYDVDAFMVIRHGKIVYEKYNTMYPNDKHIWWSSGKVIGSTMLALLEEEGKVDTQKPVSFYLHELKGSVWDSVKVIEVLDMATGLDATEHDEPKHDSRTNPEQKWYRWAASIEMFPDAKNRHEEPMDVIRSMQRRTDAYEKFEYNSIDTFLVNRIVERVTNQPLERYFTKRVWSKIGARADAYVAVSPQGYSLFYGLMNSTLEDMGRFGMIFTPSGTQFTHKPIISKKVVQKLQTQPHKSMYLKAFMGRSMMKKFRENNMTNHYQWDAIFNDGDMYKSGFGGQGLYVSPAKDMVVVWFGSNDGNSNEEAMARAIVTSF